MIKAQEVEKIKGSARVDTATSAFETLAKFE
jgi:hypothetical protein